MPWQLVYTSVPSGLVPGRSGFCTAARHRGIPERLVAAIERMSVYEPPADSGRPVIFSYRTVTLGSDTYGIITRFCDAGLDYTSRRNYLAHHLIFNSMEMAMLPPPAEIARRWPLWHSAWNEAARWLTDDTDAPVSLRHAETTLPAKTWEHLSGDAGNAAALCPEGTPADHILSRKKLDDDALLRLFAESSLLVRGGAWSAGFTTCIQETDTPSQTPWRAWSGLPTIDPLSMGAAVTATPVVRHARTGVAPDQQPQAAASPILGGSPRKQRTTPTAVTAKKETAETEKNSSRSSNLALIFGIAGIATLLICLGAIFFLNNAGDDAYAPPPPPAPTRAVTTPPSSPPAQNNASTASIYASEMLRSELNTAIANTKWELAADLWKKLLADAPDVAAKQRAATLPLIQTHLAEALADALEMQFELLAPQFKPAEIDAFRTAMSDAQVKLKDTAAKHTKTTQTRFKRLDAQLKLLSTLPLDAPPVAVVFWENTDDNENKNRTGHFTSKNFREFLQRKQTALEFSAQAVESWSDIRAEAVTGAINPKEHQVGKALAVRPSPQQKPVLHLGIENRHNKIAVTCLATGESSPLQNLLHSGKTIRLNFTTSGAGKRTTSQILVAPDARPQAIRASMEILFHDETTGTLSIPAWLQSALGRVKTPNGHLILYPNGGGDYAKHYRSSGITRSTAENALQGGILATQQLITKLNKRISDLEKQRQTASNVAPIDKQLAECRQRTNELAQRTQALQARIENMKKNPTAPLVKLGAPWTAGIYDNASERMLPLVIFE